MSIEENEVSSESVKLRKSTKEYIENRKLYKREDIDSVIRRLIGIDKKKFGIFKK